MPRIRRPFDLPWPAVLLAASAFGVVSTLGFQVWEAESAHRRTAEELLRDYAEIAARSFVPRASTAVGYRMAFPLVSALASRPAENPLPSPEELAVAAELDADRRPAAVFALGGRGSLEIRGESGLAGSRGLRDWLSEIATSAPPEPGLRTPMQYRHGEIDGSALVAVLATPARAGPSRGFVLAPDAVRAALSSVLDDEPLLPELLFDGSNPALGVKVFDPAGRIVVRRERSGRLLTGTAEFADAYRGILEGWSVQIGLEADAAPDLVPGGIPDSRGPLLLVLLLLAGALLGGVVVLVERHRRLARMRADFLAQVSHELRTPLTQIRMFVETLILGRVRNDEERTRALEVIEREARRLGWLVENVLRLSRGDGSSEPPSARVVSLNQAVERAAEELRPFADSRKARIEWSLEESAVVVATPDALHQILLNLLANALKYGHDGQRIEIEAEREGGRVRLAIADQGPGIPPGDRDRVWRRFVRLDRERERATAGTGLGLAVVRELVETYGGAVAIEDRGPGPGARIVVELPAAPESAARGVPAPVGRLG